VASGERTCTLHHIQNNAPLVSGELLVMDVGARADYYAADITRTFALGGHAARRQQLVYESVQEAQQYALSLLKPGALLRQYEKHGRIYR
jgi:Xaa-Pro aminopeptidase